MICSECSKEIDYKVCKYCGGYAVGVQPPSAYKPRRARSDHPTWLKVVVTLGLAVVVVLWFNVFKSHGNSTDDTSSNSTPQPSQTEREIKERWGVQDPDFTSYSSVESALDKLGNICEQIGYDIDASMGTSMSRCERDIVRIDYDLESDKGNSHSYTSSDLRNKWEEALDSVAQDSKDSSAQKLEIERRERLGDRTEQ